MTFVIAIILTVAAGVTAMWLFAWLFGEKKKPSEPTAEEKVDAVLAEQEKEIDGFEKKLNQLATKRREMSDDLQVLEKEITKWNNLIEAAKEKESDIRACVLERMSAERRRDNLAEEASHLDKIIGGLQEQLKFARIKIEDARAERTTLGARLEAAKIREKLADSHVDLESLEDEAIGHEAKAEAYEETSQYQQDFIKKNVVSNVDVDNEVDRILKKRK